MDQDSTKSGMTGGERRNWRERLGVGQDLPKISDEFQTTPKEFATAAGDGQPAAQASVLPGTPVARPAPMAPRYARATAPGTGNGKASAAETPAPKPAAAAKPNAGPAGLRPWAASIQPAHRPAESSRPQRMPASTARSGAGKAQQPAASSTSGGQRPGYTQRTAQQQGQQRPQHGQQRPQPTRGPAAYAQAAPGPRSVAAPSAAGNDSFGERLRAQREAAEKLAQQRLAAARDRSTHSGPDSLTMLAPGRNEAAPQRRAFSQRELQSKQTATEQPRFTFAQEEIVAAQQETAFGPDVQPAPGSRLNPSMAPPTSAPLDQGQAPAGGLYGQTRQPAAPHGAAGAAPGLRAEYRHEDDSMFEDPAQGLRAVPGRASAADYSAAYREFEDEFDEEPRKGRGPLLLLASLAGLAVVSGGLIYWYQQSDATPTAEVRDLPVVAAPEGPAKAMPAPAAEEVQQAAQPVQRKQIYDRIIGEETLEPERIVPTEEEPQLRQIQQPQQQQLPAAGEVLIESQGDEPAALEGSQSTEPLPQPMPPPPGAGEQGNLLVPGRADSLSASASPARSSPEPTALALPARAESEADAGAAPQFQQAAIQPASETPAPSSLGARAMDSGDRSPSSQAAGPSKGSSIYPAVTEPLAYAEAATASPEPAPSSPIEEAEMAALPEPEAALVTEPEAETPAVEPPVEPQAEQVDVPLPKAKPAPPARTKTAAKPEPQAQPQRTAAAQSSSSGPVQIIPADVASGQAPAQVRAVQPQAQLSQSGTRKVGREPDPMAGGRTLSSSPGIDSARASPQPSQPAALQQVASIAPDSASRGQEGGGYVVQLASFRSESEALSDYKRLVARHPQLVSGLGSRVTQASLGASGSFYRLGVGPLGDRGTATQLCNDLIAAGEKDCLVRRQ